MVTQNRSEAPESPQPSLLQLLREDRQTNGRFTKPGFQAMAVHRFGVWRVRLRGLPRLLADALYYALFVFVRNVYGIELFYTTTVGRRLEIGHQGGIVIHPCSVIGDDCLIHHNVTLGAATNHGWERQAPKLGNRVTVGTGAVILGAITIGDDAHIGPNCVVTSNVPAGAVVFTPRPRMVLPRAGGQA